MLLAFPNGDHLSGIYALKLHTGCLPSSFRLIIFAKLKMIRCGERNTTKPSNSDGRQLQMIPMAQMWHSLSSTSFVPLHPWSVAPNNTKPPNTSCFPRLFQPQNSNHGFMSWLKCLWLKRCLHLGNLKFVVYVLMPCKAMWSICHVRYSYETIWAGLWVSGLTCSLHIYAHIYCPS